MTLIISYSPLRKMQLYTPVRKVCGSSGSQQCIKKGEKLLKNIFDWKIMISTNFHCICIIEVATDMRIIRLGTFLAFDQKFYIRVRVYVVASRFVDSIHFVVCTLCISSPLKRTTTGNESFLHYQVLNLLFVRHFAFVDSMIFHTT